MVLNRCSAVFFLSPISHLSSHLTKHTHSQNIFLWEAKIAHWAYLLKQNNHTLDEKHLAVDCDWWVLPMLAWIKQITKLKIETDYWRTISQYMYGKISTKISSCSCWWCEVNHNGFIISNNCAKRLKARISCTLNDTITVIIAVRINHT